MLDVDGHVIVDSRNDVGGDEDGEIVTVRDDRERDQKAADAPESGRSATEGQDLA